MPASFPKLIVFRTLVDLGGVVGVVEGVPDFVGMVRERHLVDFEHNDLVSNVTHSSLLSHVQNVVFRVEARRVEVEELCQDSLGWNLLVLIHLLCVQRIDSTQVFLEIEVLHISLSMCDCVRAFVLVAVARPFYLPVTTLSDCFLLEVRQELFVKHEAEQE